MRIALLMILALLAGCNGSSDNDSALQQQISAIPNEATAVQALKTEVSSLTSKVSELQLIGKIKGQTLDASPDAFRTMGEFAQGVNAVSFGPCTNMGIFQGRGGSDTADPLRSQFEVYKTAGCAGNANGIFTSYNDVTGLHDIPPYMAWDGPNCTGNLYIETDVPQNTFPGAILSGGIVFTNPIDGLAYWIQGNQTPEPITIQSALNTSSPANTCGPDIETRMAVHAIRNDASQSGIPDSLVPGSWTTVAP